MNLTHELYDELTQSQQDFVFGWLVSTANKNEWLHKSMEEAIEAAKKYHPEEKQCTKEATK